MPTARQALGRWGETHAAAFLRLHGFAILARNLRLAGGEIDLLCQEGEEIVVIEVKTQTLPRLLDPLYQITPAKQRTLWRLAQTLTSRYPERNIRIDALTLYWGQPPVIRHYRNIL